MSDNSCSWPQNSSTPSREGAGYLCSPVTQLSPSHSGGKTVEMTVQEMKEDSQRPSPDLYPQQLSFMYTDCSVPPAQLSSSSTSYLGDTQANTAAGLSSLTGRVGRQRPMPRHPCHHCKTRWALGPQPFSIFELFLAGGCLLFWALYLEQYSTVTQKNTVSQVSRKQIEQET